MKCLENLDKINTILKQTTKSKSNCVNCDFRIFKRKFTAIPIRWCCRAIIISLFSADIFCKQTRADFGNAGRKNVGGNDVATTGLPRVSATQLRVQNHFRRSNDNRCPATAGTSNERCIIIFSGRASCVLLKRIYTAKTN